MLRQSLMQILQPSVKRTLAIGTLILCLGITLGLYSQPQQPSSAGARRFTPFAVHQQTAHFTSDPGLAPIVRERNFAVRADGSMVLTYTAASPDGEIGTAIQIWDRRENLGVWLEPFTRSRQTLRLTEDLWQQAWEVNHPGCPSADSEAARTAQDGGEVLGIPVRRMETRHREMRSHAVVAPAFDCYPLRKTVWFPGGSRNESTTVSVSPGEPEASLFTVPEGYVGRSPAELEAVFAATYPGHEFWGKATLETVEAWYRRYNRR